MQNNVFKLHQQFPDIPLEAILKQDILRLGLSFNFKNHYLLNYKSKDYFIFSFDLDSLETIEASSLKQKNIPEEIRFFGGEWGLRPTILSVRLNLKSPYQIIMDNDQSILKFYDQTIAQVDFHPQPNFYKKLLNNGKSINEIAPVLEWGYLIYLTVYRLCQHWDDNNECLFCDINKNYQQQVQAGKPYTKIKTIKEILEALNIINLDDTSTKAITVTGGSITKNLAGKNEIDFYLEYLSAIHQHFPKRWILKAAIESFPSSETAKLKNSGVDIYHPNFEVWEPRLFKTLCPGKENFIGRDRWINQIIDAAEIFGHEYVIPNFVAGIEMAQPYGFINIDEAINSTQQGLDFFMSKKIVPRFTTWCIEPFAKIKPQLAPPLEYFVKLLHAWKTTFEHYQLSPPPGYGPAGVGKAVFSVSAFMDIIEV